MFFKDDEVDKMQSILKRLEPNTVSSIQVYNKDDQFRKGYTIAIYNKWRKPLCVFQNYERLSPFRMKLLLKLSKQIPYPLHVTYPYDGIVRVGWKI